MPKGNCLIRTQEVDDLIKEIKETIPEVKDMSDAAILAKIGSNQDESGNLPSINTMRSVFSSKAEETSISDETLIDTSVLDEVANLTYRNAQKKADRVSLIARLFSQVTTRLYEKELQKNPELKRAAFAVKNFDTIAEFVKTKLLSPNNRNLDEYQRAEMQKIQDNWRILLEESLNILYNTEGISASIEDVTHNEGDETGTKEDSVTPDGENEVSIKDGWMVKAREMDLRDTLSTETRKILSQIKRVDKNGNPLLDDLGFVKYVEPDVAHLTLLEKTSTIKNAEEFIPALQELAKRQPWVNQVLNLIKEDLKKEFPTVTPKLYTDLRKEFLPYYVQLNKDGNIVTKQVNRTPSIEYLLNEWRSNFEQGITFSDYSVYDNKWSYSKDNARIGLKVIDDIVASLRSTLSSEEGLIKVSERVGKLFNMIGIDVSNEEIQDTIEVSEDVEQAVRDILSPITTIFSQISKGKVADGTDFINEFSGALSQLATILNTIPQGTAIATFREAGETRQSYSAPSFLGNLLNSFKDPNRSKVKQYIDTAYGRFHQFFDGSRYRNFWLDLMVDKYNDKGRLTHDGQPYRNLLNRKIVIHRDSKEFNDWTEQDYFEVAMTEFLTSKKDPQVGETAYYALPLLADAPSAEFIKFIRYTDSQEFLPDGSGFKKAKDIILDKLAEVAYQEWERIQLVEQRKALQKDGVTLKNGEEKVNPIANFDGKAGLRFNFFPFLNGIESQLRGKTVSEQLAILRSSIEINENLEFEKFNQQFNKKETYSKSDVENFFYNNAFAYTQMVQLLTTDLAYYKNINDFQKRFKEVYAMTNRLYTALPGISSKRRVVYLSDIFTTSNVLREVEEVLQHSVDSYNLSEDQKDAILVQYKKSKNSDGINVADAQGFVTLNAYKKVMMMTGNWTEQMEEAKKRMEDGRFSFEDFNIIWQTIKPYEFSYTEGRGGVVLQNGNTNTPYGPLKVPVQYKNSEFLLLAMLGAVAKNQNSSPLLKTLNTWMNKNDIDLVQFESGVKVGNQAPIDFNKAIGENWDEETIRKYLDTAIRDPDVVHETSWEDYGIQSATPEHLIDHEALIGSQAKKLLVADLPDDFETVIQDMKLDKNTTYNLVESLLSVGYVDGFERVRDIFSSKENLAAAIQKEMAGNTRYTAEERKACTLVDDGEKVDFQIPLHDPIQSARIQQLLNSIIKKAVTKQQTSGAACIQVSNVGLNDELKIRFRDGEGSIIFTEKEYLGKDSVNKSRKKVLRDLYKIYGAGSGGYIKYRDSVKAESVAYYECYLPAYTRRFFTALGREEGNFDINDLPEELRYILGYRIPTESKYSMQPIYIKGFLPQSNGSAIMLPSEITLTTGSDFDKTMLK